MPPKGKVQGNEAMLSKEKQTNINMTLQKNDTLQENINTNVMKESEGAEEIVLNKNQITADQLMAEPSYEKLMKSKIGKKSKRYQESKALVKNTSKESFEKMSPQELLKWATASSIVDGATELFQNVASKLESVIGTSDKIQAALVTKDLATAKKEFGVLQEDSQKLIQNAETYLQNRKGIFGIKFSEKGKSRLEFCKSLKYMVIGLLSIKQIHIDSLDKSDSMSVDDNAGFHYASIERVKENEAKFGIKVNENTENEISEKRGKTFMSMTKMNAEYRYTRDAALLEKADKDESFKKDPYYEMANRFRVNGHFNEEAYLDNEVVLAKCDFAEALQREGLENKQELINQIKNAFNEKINELYAVKLAKKEMGFKADALDEGKLKNKLDDAADELGIKEGNASTTADILVEAVKYISKGNLLPSDRKPYLESVGIHDDSLYEKEENEN